MAALMGSVGSMWQHGGMSDAAFGVLIKRGCPHFVASLISMSSGPSLFSTSMWSTSIRINGQSLGPGHARVGTKQCNCGEQLPRIVQLATFDRFALKPLGLLSGGSFSAVLCCWLMSDSSGHCPVHPELMVPSEVYGCWVRF